MQQVGEVSPLVLRVLPHAVEIVGAPPKLPWPSEGEAALDVEGIGSLGTSGGEAPLPIASVTKVMTAYVVLGDHPLVGNQPGFTLTITNAEVAATSADQALGESVIPLATGEKLTERQALEALLLPSADNIALDLAAQDAGSVSAFVAKMNHTALALGMAQTRYTDPSGYTPSTVSTPSDQIRLAQTALQVPALAQIVDMPKATLPIAGTVTNYNSLLGQSGVIGIKTGSTSRAGGCLLFASRQTIAGAEVTVLGAVLGQGGGSTDADTLINAALDASSRLVVAAFQTLHPITVLPSGTPVVEAIGPDGSHVAAVTTSAIRCPVVHGVPIPLVFTPRKHLTAVQRSLAGTVSAGTGQGASSVAVFPASLPGPGIWWRFTHIP
jgi:D-alanyl-D-alanine carboxypeptidase (penicillin-binding protein 5/6)